MIFSYEIKTFQKHRIVKTTNNLISLFGERFINVPIILQTKWSSCKRMWKGIKGFIKEFQRWHLPVLQTIIPKPDSSWWMVLVFRIFFSPQRITTYHIVIVFRSNHGLHNYLPYKVNFGSLLRNTPQHTISTPFNFIINSK